MPKTIILPIDNFAQAGEQTLAEIIAAAGGSGGHAAEVIRDPATGKVIQVKVNLPDTASQNAIDAIRNNKGVATSIVFPAVVLDENFDAFAEGTVPPRTDSWLWIKRGGAVVRVDQFFSAPNSIKVPTGVVSASLTAVPLFTLESLLAIGRTVETSAKVRFSGLGTTEDNGIFLNFGQQGAAATLWVNSASELRFGLEGDDVLVSAGLVIDTWHTVRVRQLLGSAVMTIDVNGVPKGDFTSLIPVPRPYRSCSIGSRAGSTFDIWFDDLKITTLA